MHVLWVGVGWDKGAVCMATHIVTNRSGLLRVTQILIFKQIVVDSELWVYVIESVKFIECFQVLDSRQISLTKEILTLLTLP